MNREKRYIYALALAALLSMSVYAKTALKESMESRFDDFGHYWINAKLLTEGYDVWKWDAAVEARNQQLAAQENINPTIRPYHSLGFFLLMRPFAALAFHQSILWWFWGGHLLFFIALLLLFRKLHPGSETGDAWLFLFLVFSFWPLREQLHQMQPNFVLLFLVTAALCLYRSQRFFPAGCVLGIAVHLREYIALALLVFFLRKEWRVAVGAIAGFISLKLAALAVYGLPFEISYLSFVLNFFGRHHHVSIINDSVPAFIKRVTIQPFGEAGSMLLVVVVCAAALIAAVLHALKSKHDRMASVYLFLILPFVISPWLHESHYVVLYPSITYAWGRLSGVKNAAWYAVFIAAYLFMGIGYSLVRFPYYHSGIPAILSGGKIMGVVFLFLLTLFMDGRPDANQRS